MALRLWLALVLSTMAVPAQASGPFLPETVLVTTVGKDLRDPIGFYEGRLGILTADYSGRRLAAAYRALIGKPLSPEQAKIVAAWNPEPPSAYDVVTQWLVGREKLVPHLPGKKREEYGSNWNEESMLLMNCSSDAATLAIATLRARIAQHGQRDPFVADWVEGQDQVFIACGKGKAMPQPAPANAPRWLKQDRAYQIAAALFYSADTVFAAEAFQAIAADRDSPWREIAPYLVARSHMRGVGGWTGPEDPDAAGYFESAVEAAQKVIDDPALVKWHEPARALIRQAKFRTDRKAMALEVEKRFLESDDMELMGAGLQDYMVVGTALDDLPMGRWIRTVRGTRQGDTDAYAQWQKEKSLPWLVAAAMQSNLETRQARAVIDASAGIGRDSPAYAHLSYFRILLLLETGRVEEARKAIDGVDFQAPSVNLQARNLLRFLKLRLAKTAAEFAAAAPREVAYFYNTPQDGLSIAAPPFTAADLQGSVIWAWRWELRGKQARYFDADAASVFNRFLPLDRLVQSLQQQWPPAMRNQLVRHAFARAVALQRYEIAQSLAGDLAAIVPEHRALFDELAAASDAERRRFLSVVTLLRLPGASIVLEPGLGYLYRPHVIGSYGLRWWDEATLKSALGLSEDRRKAPFGRHDKTCAYSCDFPLRLDQPPPFIDAPSVERAAREGRILAGLKAPPDVLGPEILRYAARHPNEARLPEALHLLVRATRYSHSETDISREAWSLLHRRFPADPWTKRTPFYF